MVPDSKLPSCPPNARAVDGGHRAVMYSRLTGIQEDVKEEGTHFMIPWLQRPVIFDVRTRVRHNSRRPRTPAARPRASAPHTHSEHDPTATAVTRASHPP